jgi:inorganic pyrophosphatase/exopolyphosphatase
MDLLKTYLVEAKAFNTPNLRGLIFGNPSVDMDSVVGSIVMSYYYGSDMNPNQEMKGIKYTPVINCPRDELNLRFDIIENLR